MRKEWWMWWQIVLWLAMGPLGMKAQPEVITYRGMCDASAAAALGEGRVVVANDEDNELRIYEVATGGLPLAKLDLNGFLELENKNREVDLEGAARVGDIIYWISSHGRNKNGKLRPNRHRFFATKVSGQGAEASLEPVGRPYRELLRDLLDHPSLGRFGLAAASRRAPKEPGALNIEGLAEGPDGSLLIGFRNPIPGGRALAIPMLNPEEVIGGARAKLGEPILLDLGGLGIRDWIKKGRSWWIVAGEWNGGDECRLYEWRGGAAKPRGVNSLSWVQDLGLSPEAIVFLARDGYESLYLLSDDGTLEIGNRDCKDLEAEGARGFRGVRLAGSFRIEHER